MRSGRGIGLFGAFCVLAPCAFGAGPNILLIVADDIGVDHVGVYGEGADVAPTPVLDSLAASGVRFRNVWANPTCSPTRATLLTGRYGFRTGLGQVITDNSFGLHATEITIPEALAQAQAGYVTAAFGKWHLASTSDLLSPNKAGFQHYRGALGNFGSGDRPENYFRAFEVEDGVESEVTGYDTTRVVGHASAWIQGQTSPWFCAVFFHTPHTPFHAPPPEDHDQRLPPGPPVENPVEFYKAMVQSMDTQIGRLIANLGPAASNTVIVFVGDNGTPTQATVPPFVPQHAKATVFEGGVNVPLIIQGAGVPLSGQVVDALVNTTDLFGTILQLAGVHVSTVLPAGTKHDSVSLVPYLKNLSQPPLRATVFAEKFSPNGTTPPTDAERVIRNTQYKLRRIGITSPTDELYDLLADPFESVNLLQGGVGGLTVNEQAEYQALSQALIALLAS